MKKLLAAAVLSTGIFLCAQDSATTKENKGEVVEKEIKKTGFLGVKTEQLSEALAAQLNIKHGIVIQEVVEGTPAAKAGLKKFDVIKSIDGKGLDHNIELVEAVQKKKEGDKVSLEIVRAGKTQKMDIVLGGAPKAMKDVPDFEDDGFPAIPKDMLKGNPNAKQIQDMIKRIQKDMKKMQGRLQIMPPAAGGNLRMQIRGGFNSSITMNDGEHNITVKTNDKGKTAKVTDKEGNVIYEGPINTDEEMKRVPADVRAKLKRAGGNFQFKIIRPDMRIKPFKKAPQPKKIKPIEEEEELQ